MLNNAAGLLSALGFAGIRHSEVLRSQRKCVFLTTRARVCVRARHHLGLLSCAWLAQVRVICLSVLCRISARTSPKATTYISSCMVACKTVPLDALVCANLPHSRHRVFTINTLGSAACHCPTSLKYLRAQSSCPASEPWSCMHRDLDE